MSSYIHLNNISSEQIEDVMKSRLYITIVILIFLIGCAPDKNKNLFEGKWIDLTHEFSEETIYWPTAETFKFDTVFAGITDSGFYYTAFQYCSAEHGGTHLDAPIHFAENRQHVNEIPIERLIGKLAVVDVSDKALKNRDYLVSIDDFEKWERIHGKLEDEIIILINTGYAKFWPDREAYMGTAELGQQAVAKLHFPGLDPKAAEWLVKERNISAIGLDTPSIDYGQSTLFEAHQILFEQNIPAFENVARINELPSKGAYVFALPMKIKGGSGGPLRIVAFVPVSD